MTTPPSFRKVNPADSPILFLGLASPDPAAVDHQRLRRDRFSRSRSRRFRASRRSSSSAQQKYAVRIEADPDAAAARGLDPRRTCERRRGRQLHRRPSARCAASDRTSRSRPRARSSMRRTIATRHRVAQRRAGPPRRSREGRSTASRTTRSPLAEQGPRDPARGVPPVGRQHRRSRRRASRRKLPAYQAQLPALRAASSV